MVLCAAKADRAQIIAVCTSCAFLLVTECFTECVRMAFLHCSCSNGILQPTVLESTHLKSLNLKARVLES